MADRKEINRIIREVVFNDMKIEDINTPNTRLKKYYNKNTNIAMLFILFGSTTLLLRILPRRENITLLTYTVNTYHLTGFLIGLAILIFTLNNITCRTLNARGS